MWNIEADPKADISVIIVNYGTAELAIAAVASVLARGHGGRAVDVHLVDNGSPGDDAERLRAAHDAQGWGGRVTLYLERENHGFGRGNNVVLEALARRASPPTYVFLCNPDARLANEAIDILAGFLDAHPQAAAAGAAIVRLGSDTPVTAAFRFPGIASQFAETVGIGLLARPFEGHSVALPPELERQPVDWVTGAAFMARFAALREAGFFDPDFFLYYEETELMWRLHAAGQQIWFVPEARVEHIAGAATGMQAGKHRSRARPVYLYDSWRLFHVKTRGVGAARLAALAGLAGASINVVQAALRRQPASLPARYFGDFWRHVLHPLFLGDPRLARPDGKTIKERRA